MLFEFPYYEEALEMEIPGVGGRAEGQHFAPGVHSERVGRLRHEPGQPGHVLFLLSLR